MTATLSAASVHLQVSPKVSRDDGTLVLYHAATRARDGDYDGAVRLVEELMTATERSPAALDLLARIRVQQGDVDAAQRLWTEAQAAQPGSPGVTEALTALARWREQPAWARSWRRIAPVGLLVGCIALGGAMLLFTRSAPESAVKAAPPPPTVSRPGPVAPAELAVCTSLAVDARAAGLTGVDCTRDDHGVVRLVPREGLFARSSIFDASGAALVRALAASKPVVTGSYTIRLTGHANDLLPRPGLRIDNEEIAMRRALAVFRLMRATEPALAASRFVLRTAGADTPPFPHGAPNATSRNRTVVIELVQSAEGRLR